MTLDIQNAIYGISVDLDTSFREMEIFLLETEKFFEERKTKVKYENEYYEDLNEPYLFYHWFPEIQRRSFIILLAIIIESEIRSYCSILYKYGIVSIKYSDLQGSIIEKFIIYSNKLAGISFDFPSDTVQNIKSIIELRNCLVHSSGYLKEFNKPTIITDFANRFDGINIKDYQIHLSKQFCKNALRLVSDFFNEIFRSSYEKYNPSNE